MISEGTTMLLIAAVAVQAEQICVSYGAHYIITAIAAPTCAESV